MRGALSTSAPSAQMRAAFLSYQVAGAIGAFVRQNRKEGTPAMNILADPNMTDSEAALAAPAPFVELRRGYYGDRDRSSVSSCSLAAAIAGAGARTSAN